MGSSEGASSKTKRRISMPKTIVVGCDGTWNDRASETNIHWLTRESVSDEGQLVYYDEGVGTAGDFDEKIGGNFGVGLSANVRQAYAFIRDNYEPGDAVFLLGFSRGAFTVRSLAGFMRRVGRLGSADVIDDAYVYYRVHEPGEDDSFFERLLRPEIGAPIPVRFLGVFDTVGALGLPFEDFAKTHPTCARRCGPAPATSLCAGSTISVTKSAARSRGSTTPGWAIRWRRRRRRWQSTNAGASSRPRSGQMLPAGPSSAM